MFRWLGPHSRRGRRPRFRVAWKISWTGQIWMTVGSIFLGLGLALWLIQSFESKMRPMVVALATAQMENEVVSLVEQAVLEDLAQRAPSYSDFVTLEYQADGRLQAIVTNMAEMNQLRAKLMDGVLEALEDAGPMEIQIPLGSLFDLDILWGRGPAFTIHAMTVGTVDGEWKSEFSEAGVNQTLHRIYLELRVPLTLLLPGGWVETVSETRLCVAETVILGQVPETYLQLQGARERE